MSRYLLRRTAELIPVLLGASLIVFLMIHLIPGDPALLIAGLEAGPETIARLRVELGLDQPLYVQFWRFLRRAATGDLGVSIRTGQPVALEIADRLPYTVRIALSATVLATLIGVVAGTAAALRHNRAGDGIIMVLSLLAVSTPSYWLALMLMLAFSLWLGLLPSIGIATPWHYVLPSVTLAAQAAGNVARMTRSSMLEVVRQEYVASASARGLPRWRVIGRHALKNALIPVLSVIGLRFGGLMAGTVLVESVFAIPGVGRMVVDAVLARDYPMIQGGILVIAFSYIVVNAITDVLYGVIDPRVRVV